MTIGLLIGLGSTLYGNAGHLFRERKAGTYLSFVFLVGSGVVAARIAARVRGQRFARFWWVTAVLFAYMGGDDLFVVHERLDRWAHHLLGLDPDHAVTDHFDDAIVGVYSIVPLTLAWRFRAELVRLPYMVLTMIPAFAAFLVMLFFDWQHGPKVIEDSFKILSGALILVGFLAAWLDAPEARGDGTGSPLRL